MSTPATVTHDATSGDPVRARIGSGCRVQPRQVFGVCGNRGCTVLGIDGLRTSRRPRYSFGTRTFGIGPLIYVVVAALLAAALPAARVFAAPSTASKSSAGAATADVDKSRKQSTPVAPATAPALPQRPAGGSGTIVVPDRFLRRWDPVTVFFARDEGPARGGPEDRPERLVSLTPLQPGAFVWLDARTLQFRPADPWPPLARVTLKTAGTTVTLATLMVPPSETLPSNGSDGLDPVDAVTLTFPDPIDPVDLAKMVSIELRPLPGIDTDRARWLSDKDFDVKVLERAQLAAPATYVLALRTPVPLGTRAIVHFRLSLDDAVSTSFTEVSFSTAEGFRVARAGTRQTRYPVTPEGMRYTREQAIDGGTAPRTFIVEFTSPPAKLGPVQARGLVRFTPAVGNLVFAVEGRELAISGDFAPQTVYRATIVPTPIADQHGRPLSIEAESEVYFFFPARESFAVWSAGEGILERFGPKMAPIQGRGEERIDLRIYPIDPLDRSLWPFPGQPLMVDESGRPPGPGEEPGNFTDLNRNVPPREIETRIRALGSPPVSTLVSLPLKRQGAAATFGLDLEPHLAYLSGKQTPGTYLVGIRALGGTSVRAWMRLQVTDLSLTTLEEPRGTRFVVTSIQTGMPVTGAMVRVEASVREPGSDWKWETLAGGATEADGSFSWEAPGKPQTHEVFIRRIVVDNGADKLVLNPARPPEVYSDNQWTRGRGGWLDAMLLTREDRSRPPETIAHIFTERPVYRPEEKVHIKGYVRLRKEGRLEIGTPAHPVLIVEGPGDLVWRYPVTLTDAGSFYRAFSEEKVPTGTYTAHLEDDKGIRYGNVSFRIEAYRLPDFEVQLYSPDRVPLDREFKVSLTATYYAGGRAAARPLQWRVTQFPYSWTPKAFPGFLYSSDARFSGGGKFESTPRLERQDQTGEEGDAAIVLNPAIEPTSQPRSYIVEATVTGADDQTVTATRQVIALPPFVLGLKVPRYIERAAKVEPEVIVVGPDDKATEGTPLTVRLLNRQWHSHLRESDFSQGVARYITDIVDEKVAETKITSGPGPVVVPFPISKAGVYIIEVEAHDRLGRAQVVSTDLYAGGEEPIAWPRPTTHVFEVAADKKEYDPGDEASIVLKSPFQKAQALAVIEAPEGNEYQWLPVENGAATFKMTLRKNFAPRVPVHFVLMRGRVPGTAPVPGSVTDLGKPATMTATEWLKVNPVENRAEVKLTYPEKARPGQKIEIEIALADRRGAPLSGEVTLWLVDQAVLALGKEQRLDPVPDFITDVRSLLRVHDSRNLAFGYLPFAEQPGGDHGANAGVGSLLDRATVRRNFQTVPYFNPAIQVGPDGHATVTVELPDNLTNFKIRAKAACGPDRFGFATGEIAVRLPVIVQPALPRFVRPGDAFTAGAIGRIVEGETGPGASEVHVEGLDLKGPAKGAFTWTPNRPQRIEFAVGVPTPSLTAEGEPRYGEALFRVGVRRDSDGASDAFEVKLPVRADRGAVVSRVLKDLAPGTPVALPPVVEKARPGTVRRSVLVSDQPGIVKMASGLEFLLVYPYQCTEQRLSRARAAVALRAFRGMLGRQDPDTLTERMVRDAMQWIGSTVDRDGLVSYWPGSQGYVSLTAWSVMFMTEARDAGFASDTKIFDHLVRSLEQALRSDYGRFIDGEAFAERTWALAALARAGKFDAAYAAELARKAQYLDLEGSAEIVQAFARGGQSGNPAVQTLNAKLTDGIITRLHEGREIYGGLQKGRTRSGLILAGETRTIAEITRAFALTDPKNPRLPLLADALVTLGREDGWGDTNSNASALLALADRLKPPIPGSAPRTYTVTAGATRTTLATGPDAPSAFWSGTDDGAGEVTLAPGSAAGPVVVRAETSYIPIADGSRVEASSQGFVVTREHLRILKEGEPPEKIPLAAAGTSVRYTVGEVVEEHVQVVNPRAGNYVAVVIPLAAGMEPLNPALATAPPEAKTLGRPTLTPTYVSFLDDQVAFYYDALPKGTYDFYFRMRATIPGTFIQPPAQAELMYDGAVRGNSPGARVEIERKGE